jgi:hypothetical protein
MPEPTTFAAVQVVDYNPDWPRIFWQLKSQIWPSVRVVALADAYPVIAVGDRIAVRTKRGGSR